MEKEKVMEEESNDYDFSKSRLLRDKKKAEIAKEEAVLKSALAAYLIKEDWTFLERELGAITDLDLLIQALSNAIHYDNKELKERIVAQIENALATVNNAYWLKFRLEVAPSEATIRDLIEKRMKTLINEVRVEFVPDWFIKMLHNYNEYGNKSIPQDISNCFTRKAKEIHTDLAMKHPA